MKSSRISFITRPDGTPGQRWAILTLDDGTAQVDAFVYAKAWASCSRLENCTDRLVVVCGEIVRRAVYEKDDAGREHPSPGDVVFSVREAYPVEEALPLLSKGLKMRLRYDDPALAAKVARIRDSAAKFPGRLPLVLSLAYPDGTVVEVDLGPMSRVSCDIGFLSELAKTVPQGDTMFSPEDKTVLSPPDRGPFGG